MDKEESNFFTNWKYWYVLAFAGLCLVFFLNYVVSPAIKFYGGSNAAIFFGVIIASGVFIYCLFSLVAEYGLIQAREEEEKKPTRSLYQYAEDEKLLQAEVAYQLQKLAAVRQQIQDLDTQECISMHTGILLQKIVDTIDGVDDDKPFPTSWIGV